MRVRDAVKMIERSLQRKNYRVKTLSAFGRNKERLLCYAQRASRSAHQCTSVHIRALQCTSVGYQCTTVGSLRTAEARQCTRENNIKVCFQAEKQENEARPNSLEFSFGQEAKPKAFWRGTTNAHENTKLNRKTVAMLSGRLRLSVFCLFPVAGIEIFKERYFRRILYHRIYKIQEKKKY